MRTRHALLLPAVLALWVPTAVEARSTGVSGYSGSPETNGGASCEACHSATPTLAVSLTGPASVLPGSTHEYTFTLVAPPPGSAGGFDVSATAGEFSTFDAATKLQDDEVTHRLAMPADGVTSQSFRFRWTAPDTPGAVTLYGAGLSRELLMGMVDTMGTTTLSITVESSDGPAPVPQDPGELPVPEPLPPLPEPPVAQAGGPYAGWVGEPIQFDGSGSQDPDGRIALHVWDFGDGESATGETPTHAYAAPGSYVVSLMVVDEAGESDTAVTVAEIETEVLEEVPVSLRVFAPRRLLVLEGHLRHVNVPVVVDARELPPGTEATGVVVLLKNGEPVAEGPVTIRLPASERAKDRRRGHGGAVRLVRLLATVSADDAPSVEWSASIEILGGWAGSESVVSGVHPFSPSPRRVRAVWKRFRR